MGLAISEAFTKRTCAWTEFKVLAARKVGRIQSENDGQKHVVWFYDGPEVIVCEIWLDQVPDVVIAGGYTQAQNNSDKAEFEADYEATSNGILEPKQSDGTPHLALTGREGSEVVYSTHNFSDKTTWYSESVRVEAEELTDDGAGTVWSSANANWIDMTHGKVFDEDAVAADAAHAYAVIVKVDDVTKTQRAAFAASGGDYSVDYVTGKITFFASQAGKTVVADYSKAATSGFVLDPDEGTVLDIESVVARFSDDLEFNDSIVFTVLGFVDVFAPNLTPDPYDSGTRIPLVTTKYKTFSQIFDEAIEAPINAPIVGGPRGTSVPVFGLRFRYGTIRRLSAAAGMRLKISLEADVPFGGSRANATIYGLSRNVTEL